MPYYKSDRIVKDKNKQHIEKYLAVAILCLLPFTSCKKDIGDHSTPWPIGTFDMKLDAAFDQTHRIDVFGEDENGQRIFLHTRFEETNTVLEDEIEVHYLENGDVWFMTNHDILSFNRLRVYLPDTIYIKSGEKHTYFNGGWNHSHTYEFEVSDDHNIHSFGMINDGFGNSTRWKMNFEHRF